MNFIAEILKTNSFSNTSLLDLLVDVPGHGKVVVDVAYGGAFYAFVSAEKLGLNVCSAKTRDLVAAASAVTEAVKAQVSTDAAATADGLPCDMEEIQMTCLQKLNISTFRSLVVLRIGCRL